MINHSLIVDISGHVKNQLKVMPLQLVKGDNGMHQLDIELVNNGNPVALTDLSSVVLTFKKADTNIIKRQATIKDKSGKAEYIIQSEETSYSGELIFAVELFEGTVAKGTSGQFQLSVIDSIADDSAIISDTQYPILTQLIADTNTAKTNTETATANSIAATNDANTAITELNTLKTTVQANEADRVTVEANRVTKESQRITAEDNRALTETARANAEGVRQQNESTRQTKETERLEAENTRKTAESTRISSESSRTTAETGRASAESVRVTNENDRIAKETARQSAESARVIAEQSRVDAEGTRESRYTTAEANRQSSYTTSENTRNTQYTSAESTRNNNYTTAETARDGRYDTAETNRDSAYATAEDNRDSLYATAESTRNTSESARVTAENSRVTAESSRVTAENTRFASEITRKGNETNRTSNENDRKANETLRISNENDRVTQWNDILEDYMMHESDNGVLQLTTEYDVSGNLLKKKYTDTTGQLRHLVTRSSFNADGRPLLIKNQYFNEVGHGDRYHKHELTYGTDKKIIQDTVTCMPSELSDLSITRSGIAIDPLQSYSPASAPTTYASNIPVLIEQDGTPQLTNNDSFLEIHGSKVHQTFKTDVPSYEDRYRRIFVGGDTQTVEYNFGLKAANSVAECPMKLYSGLIDPANPPAPTDPTWKEVTSQAVIDRIKNQNELNITSVDTAGRTAVINGMTLVQQGTNNPVVRDDFAGKTAGNTVGNPHKAGRFGFTTLATPSQFSSSELGDVDDGFSGYIELKTQGDGKTVVKYCSVVGEIPQIYASFNVLRMVEDKYGLIPVDRTGTAEEVLARQVQWCKDNLSSLKPSLYLYGVCPTGNKAYVSVWNGAIWLTNWLSNTTSTPGLLTVSVANMNYLQSDGFIHFLAYTDPARTTDSTLLVLTGHGLTNSNSDLIENATRGNAIAQVSIPSANVLVCATSIANQQAGDTINKYKRDATTKNAETGTNETTVKLTNHGFSNGDYYYNGTRGGAIKKITVVDANTFTTPSTTGQTVGDVIYLFKYTGTQTAESTVIPSTIYTDYVSLDLQLKATAGYDVLVPQNPRRDAGLGYAVQLSQTDSTAVQYFTNNSVELESLTNAKAQAYLVEADMTALCNSLAGGSNSAFKALLKSITADVWAMGSGANANVVGYGCKLQVWNGLANTYVEWSTNNTSTIAKLSSTSGTIHYITSGNKLYALVNVTYNSDGTIPSQVSLDYINIKVALTRQPDKVSPISVNLPKNWAMLMRGFSPSWDNTQANAKRLLTINQGNNIYDLAFNGGKFKFEKNTPAYKTLDSLIQTFSKYQVVGFLIEQNTSGMTLRLLKNNGSGEKVSNTDTNVFFGLCNLYLGLTHINTQQGDLFTDSFRLFDLDKLGKPNGFTDAEALAMLNGTAAGYENPNLVDMSKVTLDPHATYDKATNTITLDATGVYQTSTIYVPVLPNNRYVVLGSMTGALSKREYCNSVNVVSASSVAINTPFVTGSNTNRLQLNLTNGAAGTFTFKDIELRRKD